MKHLIETTDLSSLGNAKYDRLILNSTKNEIIYRGGVIYEYVDLGLPSGLKWAKCNVGAETETDYGDYFQWGETTPDTDYTFESYKYCNGSQTTMTKYCTDSSYGTVDNKTTLEPEDDAATQIMGSDWRMPTNDEFQELLDNTTNEWITDYNGTGVKGMKFTSKTDTSKYIFIPATGFYSHVSVNAEGLLFVWSSSLGTPSSCGGYLNVFQGSLHVGRNNRYYGQPVRGVRK